jgi:hypothetical protein
MTYMNFRVLRAEARIKEYQDYLPPGKVLLGAYIPGDNNK